MSQFLAGTAFLFLLSACIALLRLERREALERIPAQLSALTSQFVTGGGEPQTVITTIESAILSATTPEIIKDVVTENQGDITIHTDPTKE